MSNFLLHNENDAKATAIPWVFSKTYFCNFTEKVHKIHGGSGQKKPLLECAECPCEGNFGGKYKAICFIIIEHNFTREVCNWTHIYQKLN